MTRWKLEAGLSAQFKSRMRSCGLGSAGFYSRIIKNLQLKKEKRICDIPCCALWTD